MGILLAFASCASAGSCPFGSCHAWVRIGDTSWSPSTVYPRLHPGETFEVLLMFNPSVPLTGFFCQLYEFGTPVYEVIDGPSRINTIVSYGKTSPGINYSYLWKVRVPPDTRWVNGTAPLEVFTQFSQSDTDRKTVSFDVLYAFIEGPPVSPDRREQTDACGNISQVPLSMLTVIFSVLLVLGSYYTMKQRQHHRR